MLREVLPAPERKGVGTPHSPQVGLFPGGRAEAGAGAGAGAAVDPPGGSGPARRWCTARGGRCWGRGIRGRGCGQGTERAAG